MTATWRSVWTWFAARPAPSYSRMVSTMSSMNRWTSGERISLGGIGSATWRRMGWPRRATFRIAMTSSILARALLRLDPPHVPHALGEALGVGLEGLPELLALLHRHVQRAVHARRAEGDLPRPSRGILDEVLRRPPRLVGGHDEDRRVGGDERDRRELVHGERRRPPEELVGLGDDRDGREGEQERVAVGLARRYELHTDRPGGAGLVHDADRALQHLFHRGRDGARRQVGDAPGRERDHERDRARGVRLLCPRAGGEHREGGERGEPQPAGASHRRSSPFPASESLARQSRPRATSGFRPRSASTPPTASSVPAIGRVTRIAYCPSDMARDCRKAISIIGARMTPSTIGAVSKSSLRRTYPSAPIASMIHTSTTLPFTAYTPRTQKTRI